MPFNVQYQEQAMPDWLKKAHEEMANYSRGLLGRAYQPYGGARLAEFSPATIMAHRLAQQPSAYHVPYSAATHAIGQGQQSFTAPGVAQRYMNPYEDQVVNRLAEQGGRTFREQIMPQLEHAFVGHGAHGSTRHRELAQQAARDMQEKVLEAQQAARHRGYETAANLHESERGRNLKGSQEYQQLGLNKYAGQLGDIEKHLAVGTREQQRQQSMLDLAQQDFLKQHAFPQQKLAEHAGIMQGVQAPVHAYQAQQQQPGYEWNKAGQFGHLAAALYGMGQAQRGNQGGGGGGYGYRKGGSVKRASKGFPQMPKMPKFPKAKKLGAQSLSQSSLVRQPKVGGRHTMKKGMF